MSDDGAKTEGASSVQRRLSLTWHRGRLLTATLLAFGPCAYLYASDRRRRVEVRCTACRDSAGGRCASRCAPLAPWTALRPPRTVRPSASSTALALAEREARE